MKRREFSLTAAAVLVPAMLGATAARAQPAKPREGKDYLVLGKQAPTDAPAGKIASAKGIEAVTGSLHMLRTIRQGRRQVERGRQIRIAAVLPQQPDPTGLQVEQSSDLGQGDLQGTFETQLSV